MVVVVFYLFIIIIKSSQYIYIYIYIYICICIFFHNIHFKINLTYYRLTNLTTPFNLDIYMMTKHNTKTRVGIFSSSTLMNEL